MSKYEVSHIEDGNIEDILDIYFDEDNDEGGSVDQPAGNGAAVVTDGVSSVVVIQNVRGPLAFYDLDDPAGTEPDPDIVAWIERDPTRVEV